MPFAVTMSAWLASGWGPEIWLWKMTRAPNLREFFCGLEPFFFAEDDTFVVVFAFDAVAFCWDREDGIRLKNNIRTKILPATGQGVTPILAGTAGFLCPCWSCHVRT